MNEYNDNGKHHGYWEHHWLGNESNLFVAFRGYYQNGEMINFWETFNDLGELIEKEFYL